MSRKVKGMFYKGLLVKGNRIVSEYPVDGDYTRVRLDCLSCGTDNVVRIYNALSGSRCKACHLRDMRAARLTRVKLRRDAVYKQSGLSIGEKVGSLGLVTVVSDVVSAKDKNSYRTLITCQCDICGSRFFVPAGELRKAKKLKFKGVSKYNCCDANGKNLTRRTRRKSANIILY